MIAFLSPELQGAFRSLVAPEIESQKLGEFLFNHDIVLRRVNPDDYNGNTYGVMTEHGNVMYFDFPLTEELIPVIQDTIFPIVSLKDYIANQIVAVIKKDRLIIKNRWPISDLKNLELSEVSADWDNVYNKNIVVSFNGRVQIPEQHEYGGVAYVEKRFYDAKASHSLDNIVLVDPIILH